MIPSRCDWLHKNLLEVVNATGMVAFTLARDNLDVNFGVFLFYPCFFDIICGMERLRHTFIRLRRCAKKALLGVDKMKKPAGW